MEKKQKLDSSLAESLGHMPSMIDNISLLASFDRAIRMQAASDLFRQVQQEQGSASEPCEDLSLIVERVVTGMASGREGSRQGYSVILTELLAQFPAVSVAAVLKLIRDKIDPAGEKGDIEKQCYFGRIFAINCLIQSGRLNSLPPSQRLDVFKECLRILVASDRKSYLKELVIDSVMGLLPSFKSSDELKEIALPLIKPLLDSPADECSPELLALLLFLNRAASDLDPSIVPHVSVSATDARVKSALLASSYTHPRVHLVWNILLQQAFESHQHVELWTVIDSILFASHVDNRKYLGFVLLRRFITSQESSAEDVIKYLESPNTLRSLMNHVATKKTTKMSDVGGLVLEDLKTRVETDADGSKLGLKLIQLNSLGGLHLSLILTQLLDSTSGLEYLSSFLTDPSATTKHQAEFFVTALKRGWRKWASDENADKELLKTLASKAIQTFGRLAYLSETPEEKTWGHARLMTVLNELEFTGHSDVFEVAQWIAKNGAREIDAVTKKFMKRSAKLTGKEGASRYERAFSKIVGIVALVNLDSDNAEGTAELQELWEDTLMAMSEYQAGENVNKAVLVIVSVMVELMTQSSALVRSVVVAAFRLLAPAVPSQGIKDICMAVVSIEEEAKDEEDADEDGQPIDAEEGEEKSSDEDDDEDDDEDELDSDEGGSRDLTDIPEIPADSFLPDIALEDADPEYLARVDASLADVFRLLKGRDSKNERKKNAMVSMEFKLRVVELLDIFASALGRMAAMDADTLPLKSKADGDNRCVIFDMLPTILGALKTLQFSTQHQVLYQKLERVVLKSICDVQKWPSLADYKRRLVKDLKQVLSLIQGNPTPAFVILVSRCASLLTKILTREQLLKTKDETSKLFARVISFCGTKKNLRHMDFEKFFGPFWLRVPEAGILMLPVMAESAASNTWLPRARTSCLALAVDFLKRSGKAHFLAATDGSSSLIKSFHAIEQMFLALLRTEKADPKMKPKALVTYIGEFRDLLTKTLCDSRMTSGQITPLNVYNQSQHRDEICKILREISDATVNVKLTNATNQLEAILIK